MAPELKKDRDKVTRISVSQAMGNTYIPGTNYNLTVYDAEPYAVYYRIKKMLEEWEKGNDPFKPEGK